MPDIIEVFSSDVNKIGSPETYAKAICGSANTCIQAARFLKNSTSPGKIESFQKDQKVLDGWFSKHQPQTGCGDESIPERWAAMSNSLHLLFDKANQKLRASAVEKYNAIWLRAEANADPSRIDLPRLPEGSMMPVSTTPGSLIVDDILNQITEPEGKPLFIEKTPVLFGGNGGLALYLVVEALQGPAGWVVPNHCLLGLIPFPSLPGQSDRHLPALLQRVMRLAMPHDVPLRLRWHLEGFSPNVFINPNPETGNEKLQGRIYPLVGRSVEAAVACAVLAIVERYRDSLKPPAEPADKTVRRVSPMLDAQVAVTGMLKEVPGADCCDWAIEPVEHSTLQDKFNAAAKINIDTICLAVDQRMEGIVVPKKKDSDRNQFEIVTVKTVREAYRVLDNFHDILDRYRELVRTSFDAVWHEEKTVVTP